MYRGDDDDYAVLMKIVLSLLSAIKNNAMQRSGSVENVK